MIYRDHEILINHLQTSFGFRRKVLSWILSFIFRRTQTVSFNGKQSTKLLVVCGVPQVSLLGPVLFLLYTADVIEIACRHGITTHSYADDMQLSIHTPASPCVTQISRVTACIEELERWMSSNRLKLNTNKTQFMWLGSRQQVTKAQIQCQTLTLDGVEIEFCNLPWCCVRP